MGKRIIAIVLVVMITYTSVGCKDNEQTDKTLCTEQTPSIEVADEHKRTSSDFAFDIFKEINRQEKDKNILISPISISTALTMTYNGAANDTERIMAQTLGYTGIEKKDVNDTYKSLLSSFDSSLINMSNSIWIREGLDVNKDFIDTNKSNYNAEVNRLDFSSNSAINKINDWIKKSTNNKIEKMIEPPVSPDTMMYLINAIYFKGEWEKAFDKERTTKCKFRLEDGTDKEVDMMIRKSEFEYGSSDDYKILRLRYKSKGISMYLALPKDESIKIDEFISNIDYSKWNEMKKTIQKSEDEIVVGLPKFKLEYGIKRLKTTLSNLGMTAAFIGEDADFSLITTSTILYIDDVLHKAVIEVDEKGSEGAAVTVVEMTMGARLEELIFDRPFVFSIEDDNTNTILFMGKYTK